MMPYDETEDEDAKDAALDGLQCETDDYTASKIPSLRIEIHLPGSDKSADTDSDKDDDDGLAALLG